MPNPGGGAGAGMATTEPKMIMMKKKLKDSYPAPTATYEELVQSPDLFLQKLQSFHTSSGTKFKVPTVGGKLLELHPLFVQVTSRGGIEKVIRDRRWGEVIATFNFPITITSASFVLRKYYLSLLYHFEQVHLFRKQAPAASVPDTFDGHCVNTSEPMDDGDSMDHFHGSQDLQLGTSVTGMIDGKFDNGYLMTVDLGSNQLKGVLYHIPSMSESSHLVDALEPPRHRRRRSRLMSRDPSRPKSNGRGYNFFFGENYASSLVEQPKGS